MKRFSLTFAYALLLIVGVFHTSFHSIDENVPCLMGTFYGSHGSKSITLVINSARFNSRVSMRGTLSGYNTVGGNTRPVNGIFKLGKRGVYEVTLDEPGDHQYDGTFYFTATCYSNGTAFDGRWEAYHSGLIRKVYANNF